MKDSLFREDAERLHEDLNGHQVITILSDKGVYKDYFSADNVRLVFDPSLVTGSGEIIELDTILQIEFDRGARHSVHWLRNAIGDWKRLPNRD